MRTTGKPLLFQLALLIPVSAIMLAFGYDSKEFENHVFFNPGEIGPIYTPIEIEFILRQNGTKKAGIENLYPNIRINHTYTMSEESQQPSDGEFARQILFGTNAQTILTYNHSKNKDHKGLRTVEGLFFDINSYSISPIEYEYDANLSFVGMNEKPRSCIECHGKDTAYIWSDYNKWHKAIGEFDDVITSAFIDLRNGWFKDENFPQPLLDSRISGFPRPPLLNFGHIRSRQEGFLKDRRS